MHHHFRLPLLLATVLLGNASLTAQGQAWSGLRAGWTDLAVWNRVVEASRENEVGLGLHLAGPNGLVLVAFTGRLDATTPTRSPSALAVQIGLGDFANPNFLRQPILRFVVDERDEEKKAIVDLTSALRVDGSAPGEPFKNGLALVNVGDIVRLSEATTISGNVFGFQVTFRRDQILALREFVKRVNLGRR